jgi:UDP:flavonoid glycosyltransferase YjiC (YdhE family)
MASIGTRGDIEPFLSIGEILKRKGHQVVYSFPQQFKNIIPEDASFHPLSSKVIELIESDEGKALMGKANLWKKFKSLLHLYRESHKINKELIVQQFEAVKDESPDLIIHNAKCNYPTLWGLKFNKPTILLCPVPYFIHRVKGHAHIGFNNNLGEFFNKMTYKLANYGLSKTICDGQKYLPHPYEFSKPGIREKLLSTKIIFSISPALFARPEYWPENARVLGFYQRDKTMQWKPEKPLEDFLNRHEKVIFLTFGSMVNTNPEQTSEILYNALKELNIPTIVNTASGGLVELTRFEADKNFHFVNTIPYEWIFKRVYAVIHHGGSGTTHTALNYGCASLILPHIIDQFGWNQLIHQHKLGPKGISINKLRSKNVKQAIYSLYHNLEYKKNTEGISYAMQTENAESELLAFIEK